MLGGRATDCTKVQNWHSREGIQGKKEGPGVTATELPGRVGQGRWQVWYRSQRKGVIASGTEGSFAFCFSF